MKKLSLIAGGVASLGLAAMLAGPSFAADHLDSTTLVNSPMADITDLYTWMTPDATKLNLVLDVSPFDPGTRTFSDAVQYVFHVWSRGTAPAQSVAAPGQGVETHVICTFASNTSVQCWVVTGTTVKDYVTGDPSASTGVTSADGKMKVFAGRRSDPFFFNFTAFRNTVGLIETVIGGGVTTDAAGCPSLVQAQGDGIRATLQATPTTAVAPCPANVKDCFAGANVMALVVQVDKTLVNDGANTNLAVYATTNMKP